MMTNGGREPPTLFTSGLPSKFETCVLVSAVGTFGEFGADRCGVELITADAVKRSLSALLFEAQVIAAIIPEPKAEEHDCDEGAVDDGGGGEIEHARARRERSGR